MNVLTVSVTEPGRAVAGRLPYRHLHGDPADRLREHWATVDAFVVVLAVGATVRLLAPLLGQKETDPAVVCVDDAARYAVVVVGGHAGGGNHLAAEVAGMLGAEPVVTTATDRLGLAPLDGLPGLVAEGDVASVTAALLAGDPVELDRQVEWPLPEALTARLGGPGPVPGARVLVTDRTSAPVGPPRPTVLLHPPSLVVGVGTSSDAGPGEVAAQVAATLDAAGLAPASVGAVATIDRRAQHPALLGLADHLGVPLRTFGAAPLAEVEVPTPSATVRGAVGTPSVAEAAALLAAGADGQLVVTKRTAPHCTVAVARRRRPVGAVSVVGLGPGDPALRTPAAERSVRHAEVVVGYGPYVDQARDLLGPAQEVLRFPIGAELERAATALDRAWTGRRVALVCSGDPGVYAMASPLLELAAERSPTGAPEITVVPGVTAGLASAALLGAPLGHDHAIVSLSDLHTPWTTIEARVRAAAESDLVLVLYNPRSSKRTWQLEKVRSLLLEHRRASTPVGVVTDAGRPDQRTEITTLEDLELARVTMTTCVIIGSSSTTVHHGRMVTPRGDPA